MVRGVGPAEDPDILNVVRTWQFLPGGELIDR
jgi:periplasmic protein TonB